MLLLKNGSVGAAVKGVQLRLNTRLRPSPRLAVDGRFGPRTEAVLMRFQRELGLEADGIVGPRTQTALASPPTWTAPPNLTKFVAELGVPDDFVRHVAAAEAGRNSNATVMDGLGNFFRTTGGRRYLLVKGDKVGVIDFRHFFAAASEAYNSGPSRKEFGVGLGGSGGLTVLLGVGNEIRQCIGEAMAWKLNSCFSPEDLGSNRLGASFGELVKVRESEMSRQKISDQLAAFLAARQPLGLAAVQPIKTAGRWDVALETLAAVVAGIGDVLVPRAY